MTLTLITTQKTDKILLKIGYVHFKACESRLLKNIPGCTLFIFQLDDIVVHTKPLDFYGNIQ